MGTFVVKVDGWTEREIESRALRLATLVRRAWRAVSRDLYATLSTKKTITERDLELLPKSWQQHADELVLGYITDTFVDSAGHIAAALDAPDGELIGDDIVDTFVNVARKRVRSMSDDVWDAVRAQLAEGIQKGESVAEIAARVRDTAGVTTPKALTIARTEVHAAHEAGSFEQALYVDPHARKEWLATKDERTRPSHREAAGQSRRIGDTFMVGGTTLRFPGDPLGEAGEVINCRCTSTYIFDMIDSVSDASTSDDALIAAFDPKSHPRGKDGRFIKKGSALFDLLTAKSDEDFLKALDNISVSEWKNMTQKQLEQVNGRIRKTQADAHAKMVEGEAKKASNAVPKKVKSSAGVKLSPAVAGSEPGSAMKMSTTVIWAANPHNAVIAESKTGDERVVWDGNAKKYKLQTGHPLTGEWTDVESFSKKGAYEKFKGDNKWVVPNPDNHVDLAALDNESDVPSIPQQVKPATPDTPNIAPVDVAPVPDVGSKPDVAPSQATTGTPVKVTTGVIWGKYEAGTPILESSDGKSQVVWNGKKYELQSRQDDGTWQTKSELTKKDAYAKLKGDSTWVTPSPQGPAEPVADVMPNVPDAPVDTTPNVPEPTTTSGVPTPSPDVTASKTLFNAYDAADIDYKDGLPAAGHVLAINKDGSAKLVTTDDGVEIQELSKDGTWSLEEKYTGPNVLTVVADDHPEIAYTWYTPAPTTNANTDAQPSGKHIAPSDIKTKYASAYSTSGTVLAISSDGKLKIVKTNNGVQITEDTWHGVPNIIDTYTGPDAVDQLFADDPDGLVAWQSPLLRHKQTGKLLATPGETPSAELLTQRSSGVNLDTDELAWKYASGQYITGDIIGVSKNDDGWLVKTNTGIAFYEEGTSGNPAIVQTFKDPNAVEDLIDAHASFWSSWQTPGNFSDTANNVPNAPDGETPTTPSNPATAGIAFPSNVPLVTGNDNVDVNTLTKLHDSGQFKNGDVLALSPSGVARLIVTSNGVEIQQQQTTGEWTHWKSADSITDLINDGLYLDSWYKPKLKPVDPEVAALQKKQFMSWDPSVIASNKLIDVEDLRTKFATLPTGMLMGISKGGDSKLIKTKNGVQVQSTNWKGQTDIVQEFNGPTAFDNIVKANPLFASQWRYPTSKTSTNAKIGEYSVDVQPSDVKFDVESALFDYYGGDMPTGDVVAVSPSGDAYLEVIPDGFALMTQYPDGSSSLYKKYTGYNQLESAVADYPQIGETWVKPKTEQSNNAPTVDFTPSKTSVQPTPTPQSNHITHSTDLLSQDKAVSSVPHYAKVSLKKKMKSANVGYWSKPEKILEQITELQIKDPMYAKFTQMQLIAALDQQTNVKATTTPYLDKMTKWANTSGGKSKIAELIGKLNYMTMPDEPTASGDLGQSSVDKVSYPEKAYLQNFFTHANVPPTSKPEDIWDTIVKVQAFPPYQKMSVATILDVLDDNSPYKTSFKDKISAWVGTKEGKAYIDAVSAQHVNPPSTKTSIPTPPSTSPISSVPKATNTGGDPLPPLKVMGSGEIDHLSPDKKSSVYTAFKNHPSTYVDSPPLSLFDAAKKTAEQHQLDIMQVLRTVDEFGANKFKVQNSKLFEKKVVDWLGTPQGAAVSQGKPIPKPPTPKFIDGVDPNVLIPSFEASSTFEYKEVMPLDAVGWFQKAKDKYGEWTTAQKNGLKTWTGGAYMTINHYLWGKSTDASQSTLDTLKHAQAGMRPSLEPILLHRGQNFTGIGNAKNHDDLMKMVGQTWKADGFMATSVGGAAAFGGNVRLDIEAPPGTPMAYVSNISHFKGENEMLLAAGLSYRIISVKQMNGTSIVRVRIVPEPVEQGDAA